MRSSDKDIEDYLRQHTWKLAETVAFLEDKPEGTFTREDHDRAEGSLFAAMNALSRHRLAVAMERINVLPNQKQED